MAPPHVKWFFIVIVGVCASLPTQSLVYAEGEGATSTNTTRVDNQCSPRHDLLTNQLNRLNTQLNSLDTHHSAQLNGLTTRQNGVDARLNRMDSRFDDLETAMADMKEYLRQRLDGMEVKAEWTLAGNKEVTSADNQLTQPTQPTQTTQPTQPTLPTQPTPAPRLPKDCQEAYTMGSTSSGVYRIAPEPNTQFDVLCEQELDGGGWTVFQLRKDDTVDFYQNWNTYKQGFGQLTGEFWLGNTKIHQLTKHHDQQLKIELTSPEGEVKFANYADFHIAALADKFRLTVSGYSGGTPPGDCFSDHSGRQFSTSDEDNEDWTSGSCAELNHGGWWYVACGSSNLNGNYKGTGNAAVEWFRWKNNISMKGTRMMIRRKP